MHASEEPDQRLPEDRNPWLRDAGLRAIGDAIRAAGGRLRVVGGAVRDALMGKPVQDIDAATDLTPEKVMAALAAAGIKAKPTGLAFGTVTAIVEKRGYEITTLRRDVATDGRRAVVAYTTDWREDSGRRDLTFNALSLDESGGVYDYQGGLADLKSRTLRLIGDPAERIKEDALRILRVFRFQAQLSEDGAPASIEPATLAACRTHLDLVDALSAERLWKELSLLLVARGCTQACQEIVDNGLLFKLINCDCVTDILQPLFEAEVFYGAEPCPVRRLCALLPSGAVPTLDHLRLSKLERHTAAVLLGAPPKMTHDGIRQFLYEHGVALTHSACALASARQSVLGAGGAGKSGSPRSDLRPTIEGWKPIAFPLRGEHLLKNGVEAGAVMGALLDGTERWWREQDFAPSIEECLAYALERHKQGRHSL